MVSVRMFSLVLNIHTLWTLSPHSAKRTQYHTPDSSVYVHSLISVQKKHLSNHVDLNKLGIWTKPPQQLNMAYAIPPPAKMEMDGDLRENWAFFKLTWENYAAATDIGKKAANVQVGTLLSVIGKEYLQIYKNLPKSAEERADTQKILERLTTTLNPNKISYTNDICLILVHRNRVKSSTHIWSN